MKVIVIVALNYIIGECNYCRTLSLNLKRAEKQEGVAYRELLASLYEHLLE